MSKYSSDSDSDFERSRSSKKSYSSRNRDRSYSSDSSSSRSRKRKDKKHRRGRSRSIDKYSRRRERSSSRHRNRSYYSKSKHSTSPERTRRRSTSKDQQKSKYRRSYSKDRRRRGKKYDKYRNKSESDSSSSSSESSVKKEECRVKNRFDKINDMISKNPINDDEDKVRVNSTVLDEINNDSFVPKQFSSTSSSTNKHKKLLDNIVIDLKSQTIKVPDVEITEPDSIFHPNLFASNEARTEKWVKELYAYRQKAFNGENINLL